MNTFTPLETPSIYAGDGRNRDLLSTLNDVKILNINGTNAI
jgi:hypothetical protein